MQLQQTKGMGHVIPHLMIVIQAAFPRTPSYTNTSRRRGCSFVNTQSLWARGRVGTREHAIRLATNVDVSCFTETRETAARGSLIKQHIPCIFIDQCKGGIASLVKKEFLERLHTVEWHIVSVGCVAYLHCKSSVGNLQLFVC